MYKIKTEQWDQDNELIKIFSIESENSILKLSNYGATIV